MLSKTSTIISVLVLAVYLSTSFNGVSGTIMCYNCTSYPNNTACSDPMDENNVQMIDCADNYYCIKVKYSALGYNITSRGCDPKTNDTCGAINNTLSAYYPDLSGFVCTTCETDHCNSAVSFEVPLVAMVVSLLAVQWT